jgi:hypothetical protein
MDEKLLSSIEGNTLSLHETEIVLEHGITIGGKSVTEHLKCRAFAGFFSKWTVSSLMCQLYEPPGRRQPSSSIRKSVNSTDSDEDIYTALLKSLGNNEIDTGIHLRVSFRF